MSLADFNDAQNDFWNAIAQQDVDAAEEALNRMRAVGDNILLTRNVDTEIALAERALEAMR